METIIHCTGITKTFDQTKALDGINLEIQPNKIYGLLGRNGAGKTTLIKIIGNQLFPNQGTIRVFGQELYENEENMKKICIVRENSAYPKEFKVRDIMETGKAFYPHWDHRFAEYMVRAFDLDINKKFKALSRGMQSSVSIMIGLASRAPLTIFDEAYLGLDASMRQLFYDILLEDYTQHPRTILFSSHLIDECSNLLEDVIILDKGKVLLHENVDEIKQRSFFIAGRKEQVESYLKGKRVLHQQQLGKLVSAAVFHGITDEEMQRMERDELEIQPMSLQRLFIYLTARNGGEGHEHDPAAI